MSPNLLKQHRMHGAQAALAIMAAGRATRFGALKQLTPVGPMGESLLEFTIYNAIQAGFQKIVLILRSDILRQAEPLLAKIPTDLAEITWVLQDSPPSTLPTPKREKPWGTAHAVLTAAEATQGDIAVVNADDYYGTQTLQILRAAAAAQSSEISIVTHILDRTLSPNGSVSRGICRFSGLQDIVLDINETLDIHREAGALVGNTSSGQVRLEGDEPVCMNTWFFTRLALNHVRREWLSFIEPSGGWHMTDSEFGLAPVVKTLMKKGLVRVTGRMSPEECFGITNPGDETLVLERFAAMHDTGQFPSPLWRDSRDSDQ